MRYYFMKNIEVYSKKESEDKMTILDLINKSVTGEAMPEKVEYDGKEYEYHKGDNDYINYNNNDYLFEETTNFLDEVKIIDEPINFQQKMLKKRLQERLNEPKKAKVMASLEKLVDDLMGYGE